MRKTGFSTGGRPLKDIKPEMVEKLASIGCTCDEIATVLECCRDTLYARFSDSLKKGQHKAKIDVIINGLCRECIRRGFEIVDHYRDDGYSATSFQRSAFQRLFSYILISRKNCT